MTNSFKYGTVKIANEIIDVIARSAADEINGVYYVDDGREKFSKKNNTQVLTEIVNDKINVNLQVVLNSNVNVLETVENIQENVKRQLETMIGLEVENVNIKVLKLMMSYE
ncbi:MAG: Asp23/Gls24 family envelope stress response protein [Tissierellia bacterium]|nr:Asp23/Gls24 family envelope stress response protein [Tissierellia bacterium]